MEPFQHWLEAAFNESDADIQFTSRELAQHFTRFNREIGQIRDHWSDVQIAKGVWYLYGCGSGYLAEVSGLEPGPLVDDFFSSVPQLYTDLFEARCSHFFSHIDQGSERANPLNSVCYMLWDMDCGIDSFRFSGIEAHINHSIQTLERLAESPHPAVIESVIHGLGHMIDDFRERAQPPLEKILSRDDIPTELHDYARNAIQGNIL